MAGHFAKGLAVAAFTLAAVGCGNPMNAVVGDGNGVPLAELDMTGAAPTELVLAGPDRVVIRQGDRLAITVSGDPAAIAVLRFALDGGRLSIARERGSDEEGKAVVAVTMPSPREIVLAGSGDIEAPTIVDDAAINIAGSGDVAIARVSASRLNVNLMGSGSLAAAGTAQELDLNIAGSGELAARGLTVQRAAVNIAGSGGGEFASDGNVDANVAGSGEVTVHGRAQCRISAIGSGRLRCANTSGAAAPAPPTAASQAPAAPTPER